VPYSDDDGTLTLPITPLNSLAARIPGSAFVKSIARGSNIVVAEVDTDNHGIAAGNSVTVDVQDSSYDGTFTVGAVLTGPPRIAWGQAAADDASGGVGSITKTEYVNGGGLAIDDQGLPHIIISLDPTKYIRRNAANTAWVETSVANPLGGITHIDAKQTFWLRGALWMLTATEPGGFRRVRLIRIDGTTSATLSGDVGPTGWEPCADPVAWRRFGTIEILSPDGALPRVYRLGDHARIKAAA
jgi:hypothetical protein